MSDYDTFIDKLKDLSDRLKNTEELIAKASVSGIAVESIGYERLPTGALPPHGVRLASYPSENAQISNQFTATIVKALIKHKAFLEVKRSDVIAELFNLANR